MSNDQQARCIQIRQVTSRVLQVTKSVSKLDQLLDVADVSAAPDYQGAVESAAKAYSAAPVGVKPGDLEARRKLKQALPAPRPVVVAK